MSVLCGALIVYVCVCVSVVRGCVCVCVFVQVLSLPMWMHCCGQTGVLCLCMHAHRNVDTVITIKRVCVCVYAL